MSEAWPWIAFVLGWLARFTDRAQYTIVGPEDKKAVDVKSYLKAYWWKLAVRLGVSLVVFAAASPVGIMAALIMGIGADAGVESLLERGQAAVEK